MDDHTQSQLRIIYTNINSVFENPYCYLKFSVATRARLAVASIKPFKQELLIIELSIKLLSGKKKGVIRLLV